MRHFDVSTGTYTITTLDTIRKVGTSRSRLVIVAETCYGDAAGAEAAWALVAGAAPLANEAAAKYIYDEIVDPKRGFGCVWRQ
jgi:ribosomal protein L30E